MKNGCWSSATLEGLDQRIAELKSLQEGFDSQEGARPLPINRAMDSLPAPKQPPSQKQEDSRLKSGAKLSPTAMEEFKAKVVELAQQGQKAEQIAKDTGRPQGEVELILRLNNQEV